MKKKLLYTIGAAVGISGLVVGSIVLLSNMQTLPDGEEAPILNPVKLVLSEQIEKLNSSTLTEPYNLLVIGSDAREGQRTNDGQTGELNDVTILVKVDTQQKRTDVVSFPRDTIVPMGACTGQDPEANMQQINNALSIGGADCVSKTIQTITGETIDATALVDFNAVEDLTAAVGGVPICIAEPIYNTQNGQIAFDAGEHRLQGPQALSFVRERYGFGNGGDLGRVYNQQVFLQAFMKEFRALNIMEEPETFWDLAGATMDNLELTGIKRPLDLLLVANSLLSVPSENYQFYTAPVTPHPDNPNRLALNEPELAALMAYINAPAQEPVEERPAHNMPTMKDETVEEAEAAVEEETKITERPSLLPAQDLYASKTGEANTVTVCP